MPAVAVTLTVTKGKGGGYRIAFHPGAPGAKGKASKSDDVPGAPFEAGGPLHPETVANTLGDKAHQLADLHRFGTAIAATFLTGAAGQAWHKVADQARNAHRAWKVNPKGLDEPIMRTYLRIDPSELQVLPWELCRVNGQNIFFDRALPAIRAIGTSLVTPAPLGEWPVRVLAVIGADTGSLQPDQEVSELRRLLRRQDHVFDCEVFDCSAPGAPQSTIVARLKTKLGEFKPHILHFAGHASFAPSALLLGADDQDPAHWWPAEDISGFLNAAVGWRLQFAFLNACRTQRPPDAADSFVRAFAVDGNALAIVTMCADVRGSDAAEYAANAYEALASGAPLDQAIAMARGALGVTRPAAYYALVSTSVAPDALLPPALPQTPERRQNLERLDGKAGIKEFVDRVKHRRQLLAELATGTNAVIVTGDTNLGKTWFLQSCCRSLAWQGHPVVYCNLTQQRSWSEFLINLLQGGDEPGLAPAVDPQTLDRLKQRLESANEAGLAGGDKVANAQSVLTALQSLGTKDKPLILALDHLEASEARSRVSGDIPTTFLSFFKPIAQGDGRIRLLLSCVNDAVHAGQERAGKWTAMALTPFPATELRGLVRDIMLAKEPTDAQMREVEKVVALGWNTDSSPREVKNMCDFLWKQVAGTGP